jgi:hypothetical protein
MTFVIATIGTFVFLAIGAAAICEQVAGSIRSRRYAIAERRAAQYAAQAINEIYWRAREQVRRIR